MNPVYHFKNWLNMPANQFKSIVRLCSYQSTTDPNESHENLRVSYHYQNNVTDTGQVKEAINFRFWNLSKGSLFSEFN